jgi:anti-sigma regulatory factor (Ser/Thr protein kinase)
MTFLLLIALILFSFGLYSFGTIFVLKFRDQHDKHHPWHAGGLIFLTTIWFAVNLGVTLLDIYEHPWTLATYQFMMCWAMLFPPFLMRGAYEEHARDLPEHPFWKLAIFWVNVLSWPLALGVFIASWLLKAISMQQVSLLLFALFIPAMGYNLLVLAKSRKKVEGEERSYHRWSKFLYASVLLVFVQSVVAVTGWLDAKRYFTALSILSRACPILFLFIGTYFQGRFAFYDVLLKRGLFFLVAQASLTLCFVPLAARLHLSGSPWIGAWVLGSMLLPLVLLAPFLYSQLERWLDRAWLGRSFSPIEAGRFFFEGIRSASSEEEIVRLAENHLADIYQSQVQICLTLPCPDPPFSVQHETSIQTTQGVLGILRMGPRSNRAPYLSEDRKLIAYLASGFGMFVDYFRLQAKRQQQEKREQELMLHASQSELKALRAQINPHFLFNALNSIAGLIHRDPGLAEQTVEQLAEVFRYTLKRSETEWARLGDELEFVHAYLDVERARFGTRLQVQMDIAPETAEIRIPSMMVQTLVENAVKHGVSRVRGTGVVRIKASVQSGRLVIEVADNGEGFSDAAEPSLLEDRRGTGFGLKSVQERLRGYFGSEAQFSVRRDNENSLTLVSLEIPLAKASASEGMLAR